MVYKAKLYITENRHAAAVKVLKPAFEISENVGHGFVGPRIVGALALSEKTRRRN
jgi:hypothetical protein